MATINTGLIVPEVYAGLVREKIAGRMQVDQFLKKIDDLTGDVGETVTMPAWSYVGDAADWTVGTAMTTKKLAQTKKTATIKAIAAPGVEVYDYDNKVALGNALDEAAKQQARSFQAGPQRLRLNTISQMHKSGMTSSSPKARKRVSLRFRWYSTAASTIPEIRERIGRSRVFRSRFQGICGSEA